MPTTNNEKQGLSSEVQLLISVSGIYFFYLYYGILQEQIWTTTEDDGSHFTFMLFLLLVQCITMHCCIYWCYDYLIKKTMRTTKTNHYQCHLRQNQHQII